MIAEAAGRLAAAAPQAQVFLCGSHARGNAGPDSDLDFLVVEPTVDDPVEESVRLRRALRDLDLFADVVVVSEHEVQRWRDVHGTLIHSALSEGRLLAA
ncbi:MAG TPA: nucleotidyltransferase domain-containing protein [Solirubrobacteraceae bacterium]|nr:nucleotidyltransferase domain-containing protein [Solirubrobacteraceae bacterium]